MATVNPWAKFKAMMPATVRYRAEVLSIDTVRGTSLVRTTAGDQLSVTGTTAQVGDQVMVKDGAIAATLPRLPFSRVEV